MNKIANAVVFVVVLGACGVDGEGIDYEGPQRLPANPVTGGGGSTSQAGMGGTVVVPVGGAPAGGAAGEPVLGGSGGTIVVVGGAGGGDLGGTGGVPPTAGTGGTSEMGGTAGGGAGGTTPPVCVPSVEMFNGEDDDCDGVIDNGHAYQFGGHAYFLAPGGAHSYTGARAACAVYGYHVIVIDSADENAYFQTFQVSSWLGITDAAVEGTWRTEDGRVASYFNWAPDRPNNCDRTTPEGTFNPQLPCVPENCAVASGGTGQWNDFTCDYYQGFVAVCEAAP